MRINWRGAKNSKRPGQRVAVCLMEGPVLCFPLPLWGAIQPRSQRAQSENTGLSKFSTSGPLEGSTAVFGREMFFPCVDGSKRKAGPCHVDTAGWCSNRLQRPSILTKWNEVSTRGVMQEQALYNQQRHSGSHSSQHHIKHWWGWMAAVLCRIAHADISHYELNVRFYLYCTLGETMYRSCLSLGTQQLFYLGSSSRFVQSLTSFSSLSSCIIAVSSPCWKGRNDRKKNKKHDLLSNND